MIDYFATAIEAVQTHAETAGRRYYLAWKDADGATGYEEAYGSLEAMVQRAEDCQRLRDAEDGGGGHRDGRQYEVRERVYGWVVYRAVRRGGDHAR